MALEAKEREEFVRAWGTILMKTWEDDDFKSRLQSDPRSVMQENGLEVQDDATINLEAPPEDGEDLLLVVAPEPGMEARALFDHGRLDLVEAVRAVYVADGAEHALPATLLGGEEVSHPAGRAHV